MSGNDEWLKVKKVKTFIEGGSPNNMEFITQHAHQRMSQRNVLERDIDIVLRFARHLRRAGADFYVLTKNSLPAHMNRQYARLIGTVLVFNDMGNLATTYRNKKALSSIKKKPRGVRRAFTV